MSDPERLVTEIEVRYAETDQMGVVHHANYVVWFELARTHLCAGTGIPYSEIERLGYFLMVVGIGIDYRQPARYGDTVQVGCWIDRMLSRGGRFAYEVHRDDELLARGHTDHIWLHRETQRPSRMPQEIRGPFRRLAGLE